MDTEFATGNSMAFEPPILADDTLAGSPFVGADKEAAVTKLSDKQVEELAIACITSVEEKKKQVEREVVEKSQRAERLMEIIMECVSSKSCMFAKSSVPA